MEAERRAVARAGTSLRIGHSRLKWVHTVHTKHERRTCDGLALRGSAAQKKAGCGSDGKLIWTCDVRWNQCFETSKVRQVFVVAS